MVFLRTFGTKNWLERAPNCQGWNISFPSHKSSNLVAIATVQDTWKADKLIQEFSSFTFISPKYVLVPVVFTFNGLGNLKTFMFFLLFLGAIFFRIMCCFFCQDLQVAAAAVVGEPYETNFRDRCVSVFRWIPALSSGETDFDRFDAPVDAVGLAGRKRESGRLPTCRQVWWWNGMDAVFLHQLLWIKWIPWCIECLLSVCILLWYTM